MTPPFPTLTALCGSICSLLLFQSTALSGPDALSISDESKKRLETGEAVILSGPEGGERKALAAIIVPYPAAAIWEVLDDKESGVEWVDGLRAARVVEEFEGYTLVYQELKVGFLPGTFKYVIRHIPTEFERRIDFRRESGAFKSVDGYWILSPMEDPSRTLVLYQLHIDPGVPIPAVVIRNSLQKTLPNALTGLRQQVAKVEAAKEEEKAP
ncbi:MAG: SRPBCC family protein [Verrucomicrobiales bacterium]|nr:SRPBCC family protein [Verrucomicrobiales bacterium]